MKTVVLAGGRGFLGQLLIEAFRRNGYEPVVLSRSCDPIPGARVVTWDGEHEGNWCLELEGAAGLVNLAGRSVNCRYGRTNRESILDSRILSTRVLGRALVETKNPPPWWLQMSTATIYRHCFDRDNDEYHGELGGNEADAPETWHFSVNVAKAWETEADCWVRGDVRLVKMRTAMVMSPDEGSPFVILKRLVKMGLGGKAGDGKQYVSWIHGEDFCRLVLFLADHPGIHGVVNIAAPQPLPHSEFMRVIRRRVHMPLAFPHPRPLLELGAWLLRTESELLLKSRRVVSTKAIAHGFKFLFPTWQEAARDLADTSLTRAGSTRQCG